MKVDCRPRCVLPVGVSKNQIAHCQIQIRR